MIHYHGLPISGKQADQIEFARGRHVLVPFTQPHILPLVADVCSSFCLDNGAYSAWRRGIAPDWEQYVGWCAEWDRHPRYDFAFAPDVIGGTERENMVLLAKYGMRIKHAVPVYHMHESLEYAHKLAKRFSRIAIGSSGEWPTPGTSSWWGRMSDVMSAVCDDQGRPITRLHGLRMLNPKIFSSLPLSSADSCNAGINAGSKKRFGYMPPKASQRATIIAQMIEGANGASCWVGNKVLDSSTPEC